jgi:hypothetical protein
MTPAQKRTAAILCSDGPIEVFIEAVIRKKLGDSYRLRFHHFDSEAEMFRIAQKRRIDLVCVYLGNVRWKPGTGSPFQRGLNALGYLKTEYGVNVIATQGLPLAKQAERARVAFFEGPFCVDGLLRAVRACLECPASGAS